jgi:hypothetical protein
MLREFIPAQVADFESQITQFSSEVSWRNNFQNDNIGPPSHDVMITICCESCSFGKKWRFSQKCSNFCKKNALV